MCELSKDRLEIPLRTCYLLLAGLSAILGLASEGSFRSSTAAFGLASRTH